MKFTDRHFDFSKEEKNQKYLKVEPLLADYAEGCRHFDNVDLRDCNLTGAKLTMVSLEEANFQRANLSYANLAGSTLNHVDFSLANLSNVNLIAADIVRAKLIGANLSGAVMSGANLSGASLRKANLTNCIFAGANLSGVDFSGAIVKNVNFGGANLKGANLSDVDLSDVDLMNVDLTESILPEGLAGQCWFSQNRDPGAVVGKLVPGWGDEPETMPTYNSDVVPDNAGETSTTWDNLSTATQNDHLSDPVQSINDNSTVEYSTEYSEVEAQTAFYTDSQEEVYGESGYVENDSYAANEYYAETYVDESLDTVYQTEETYASPDTAYQTEETYAVQPFDSPFTEENTDLIANPNQPWLESELTNLEDEDDLYLHALDAIDAIAMESIDSSAPQTMPSEGSLVQESSEIFAPESFTLPETNFSPFVAEFSDLAEESTALLDQNSEPFNSSFAHPFVDPFSDPSTYSSDDVVADDLSSAASGESTNPFDDRHHDQAVDTQEPSEAGVFSENSLALVPLPSATTTDLIEPDLPSDPYLNPEISVASTSDINPSTSPETNVPFVGMNEDTVDAPCDDSRHVDRLEAVNLDPSHGETTTSEISVASVEKWPSTEQNPPSNTLGSSTESHSLGMSTPKESPPINSRVVQSIQSVLSRRVQYSLQRKLFDVYNNQCAITGCDVKPLLETTCIANYHHHADHPSQCLVLRSDLKTLYELKLIAIHPQTLTVLLAPQLFQSTYSQFQGKKITISDQKIYHPDPENLAQNLQNCAWYGADYPGHLPTATSSQPLPQTTHRKPWPWAYWPIALAFGLGGMVGAGLGWLPNTLSPMASLPANPPTQTVSAPQNPINIQVGDVRYNQSGIILDQKAHMTMTQAQQLGIITGDVPGEYQQQYQNEPYVSLSYLTTLGVSVNWDAESRTATLDCCQSTEPEPFDVMVNNRNWPSDGLIVDNTAYVSEQSLADLNLSSDALAAIHSITYQDDTYLRASDLKSFSIIVDWNPETRVLSLNK